MATDEPVDQYLWKLNVEAIKDFFGYNENGYFNLLEYEARFHGIGFHYISQLYLQLIGIIINFEKFSEDVSKILLNHSLIFFTYFLSGIFAKKIVNLLIKDKSYSNLFLVFYFY